MTLRVKVRQGGATDSITREYSDMIPLWYGYSFSAGMQFGGMTANQSSFTIIDIDNLIRTTGSYQVNAHNVVWITEDAPGYEAWLHRGRVARKDFGRGIYRAEVARTVDVVTEDGNVDLRGLALVEPWVRGSETGTERVIAAIGAFCQGFPRITTDITAKRWDDVDPHLIKPHPVDGEVTMPAKTYEAGTDVTDIIRDCAETEGQEVGVVIHHEGGSHLCLLYCEEDDWTAYPAPISISDQLAEVNGTTVFEPHWQQGSALQEDGQEVLSGIVSKYGTEDDAFVVFLSPENADKNDYWVEEMNDATSVTEAQAIIRAGHLRAGRANEHRTTQVSLILPASMVDQLCAGMSIVIEASASRAEESLGSSVTRRIASLKWEPKSPDGDDVEPLYWAHMQLDRPKKIARTQRGEKPGAKPAEPGGDATPEVITLWEDWNWDDGNHEFRANPASNPGTHVFGAGGTIWPSPPTSNGYPATGAESSAFYRHLGSNNAASGLVTATAGTIYRVSVWDSQRFGSAILDLKFHSDLTGAGVIVSHVVSSPVNSDNDWKPNVWEGVAPVGTVALDLDPGSQSFRLDNIKIWTVDSPAIPGTTDPTQPVGDANDAGTPSSTYANADHVHAHGDVTTGSHPAEDVEITDTGGYFTGTDVEAALQELGAGGGVSAHAAAADPHTGYQKESEKGTANGYAGLGAGALVPMAQLASGTPDGTKFVRDDGTLAAASGGTLYEPLTSGTTPNFEPVYTAGGRMIMTPVGD